MPIIHRNNSKSKPQDHADEAEHVLLSIRTPRKNLVLFAFLVINLDTLFSSLPKTDFTDASPPSPPSLTPFADLRGKLADVYPSAASAKRIAEDTGVNTSRIDFQVVPIDIWHSILKEVRHAELCTQLMDVVLAEYPQNKSLQAAFKNFISHSSQHSGTSD